MIRLRFIAGLQTSEHQLKVLERLQQNPDATIDDILLVIQQREQTVQIVNKQNEPKETIFLRGTISCERRQRKMANFQPTSITSKDARNAERCMDKGVVRPSAKRATTARSRIISQKSVR